MSTEWLVVLGVVVLLFGGSQIPKLARSLGQAQREFKHGQTNARDEAKSPGAASRPEESDKSKG